MSWTIASGHNMVKVIQLRDNGQLKEWAHTRNHRQPESESLDTAVVSLRTEVKDDPQAWLEARLPALEGPHSDRQWAVMLRELVRIPVAV